MTFSWGRAAAAVVGVGAACVAYGTFIESAAYRVRRFSVPVLPPGSDTIRVLHLSDTHLLPWQRRRRAFIRSLAGLAPDLVINTGDGLSSAEALQPLLDDLSPLLQIPGAFVFGSNDYESPHMRNPLAYIWRPSSRPKHATYDDLPTEALRAGLAAGWLDLNDAAGELTIRGTRIHVRGTEDAHQQRDHYARVSGPAPDGTVALGLTHAPYQRILDAMTADGVQLVFAGHTHGGQVCVPGFGALTSNCDLPAKNAKGLFTHQAGEASSWVHVSAGIGMSPFAPFRFACPPEVSLLSLVARPE